MSSIVKQMLCVLFSYLIVTNVLAEPREAFVCLPKHLMAKNNHLFLTQGGQQTLPKIFFIKNTSNNSLIINKVEAKNRGVQAGWASILHAKNWSGILVDKPSFALSCTDVQGKQAIDCKKVLKICEAEISKTFETGSYWLSEDKSWDEFVADINKKIQSQ